MQSGTLYKYPAESRTYEMDFAFYPEVQGGDLLASATVVTSAPADLLAGAAVLDPTSTQVKFNLSAGTAGLNYTVTVTATTQSGKVLVGSGDLNVRNPT